MVYINTNAPLEYWFSTIAILRDAAAAMPPHAVPCCDVVACRAVLRCRQVVLSFTDIAVNLALYGQFIYADGNTWNYTETGTSAMSGAEFARDTGAGYAEGERMGE